MAFTNRPPGTNWSHDPEYKRNRKTRRAQAQDANEPCVRCGGAIDYAAKEGPAMWHCGHITDRARGGGHDLANMQSECGQCSVTSGARLGAERRWAGNRKTIQRPATASRW